MQLRQLRQFWYPPKDREDGRIDPSGQQRGGGYKRGRGGKNFNNNPRGGQMTQGPRSQQQIMMQANFPGMPTGYPVQMQAPVVQP